MPCFKFPVDGWPIAGAPSSAHRRALLVVDLYGLDSGGHATPLASLVGIIGSLMLVRFCLGVGEAVALPAFNRAVTNWFPADARGFGIGIAIGGIGLGSAMTPPIAAWVMVNWKWQTVFYLASLLGIGMGLLWWLLSRNHPHEHPWVNAGEQALLKRTSTTTTTAVPWRTFMRTPTIWWLVISYVASAMSPMSIYPGSISISSTFENSICSVAECMPRLPFWPCWCFVPWAAG